MNYSEDLREATLTPREVCKVLTDHGQLLGDWIMDQEPGYYLSEETDGSLLADWLGY